ncbi:MAG TPA: RsmG family class I SAM-dependent methyltransferase, partial [Variovorax sp.]|nr:RsmG family class I SAM-dependent methyltransferase [Variovorax sp.]
MSQDAALREGAKALGVELTERQCERLLAYGALILKWNKVYNLTALRDPSLVLTHHLLDSL